jgi:preprotein translocase subunit SecF
MEDERIKNELKSAEQKAFDRLKELKSKVSEDEQTPVGAMTLRKILGGDILSASQVRRQIWLILLVVLFTVIYVAFRYQCQQDVIKINQLESKLKDAKYRALSSSSTLTERCRESKVLEALRQNKDSVLHISDQPPYIISIDED